MKGRLDDFLGEEPMAEPVGNSLTRDSHGIKCSADPSKMPLTHARSLCNWPSKSRHH